MKNIRLIAFLFNITLATVCGGRNLVWAEDNQKLFNLSKTEFTASGKIDFPFLQVKSSVRNKGQAEIDYNYGLMLTSRPFTPGFPITVKAGMLSAGGSISRLNSPELSSSLNAFGSDTVKLKELQAFLPGTSGYSKPNAIYTQIMAAGKKFSFSTDSFYDADTLTGDLTFKFSPVKKIDIGLNAGAGIYPFKEKSRSSWFNQEGFYRQGNHLCASSQIFINLFNFSTLFTLSSYQSPFGIFQNTFRSENAIKFKNFSFYLNSFFNEFDGLITSSGKSLAPLLQLQGGGKYKFTSQSKKPVIVTTGINNLLEINLDQKSHSAKTVFGVKVQGAAFSWELDLNAGMNIQSQEDGIKLDFTDGNCKTALGFKIKEVRSQVNAALNFSPDSKKEKWNFTEKLGLKLEYGGNFKISSTNTLTLSQKKENKISFTSSLSARAEFRFFNLSAFVEVQI